MTKTRQKHGHPLRLEDLIPRKRSKLNLNSPEVIHPKEVQVLEMAQVSTEVKSLKRNKS